MGRTATAIAVRIAVAAVAAVVFIVVVAGIASWLVLAVVTAGPAITAAPKVAA